MAKEQIKSTAFGADPNSFNESRIQRSTHTHTHNDSYETKRRERKNKRVQILTYESLVERLDEYCSKNDISRAEVFEAAITEYLGKK